MSRKSAGLENTDSSAQAPSVEPKNEGPAAKGGPTAPGPTDELVDEGGQTEATTCGPKEDGAENAADAWLPYQPSAPLVEDDSMDVDEEDSMDIDEEWRSSPSSTSSLCDDDDYAMDVDWWCLGNAEDFQGDVGDLEEDLEMTDCTGQLGWHHWYVFHQRVPFVIGMLMISQN